MKKKIGTWITSFNQHTLEIISNSGFDWICIDLEHSDISNKETNILRNERMILRTEKVCLFSSTANLKTRFKGENQSFESVLT